MLATLRIQLFGGLRLALADKPIVGLYSNKASALIAYLVVTRRAATRDVLATLLWGDMNDADAKMNLRQCLTNLRKYLEPYLLIARDVVAFNFDAPYALDLQDFEQLLLSKNLPDAIALYTGDFLEGVFLRDAPDFDEWAVAQRARWRELALQAMSDLVAECASRGEYARGIEYARRLVALDPWREETHRELMLMLARNGQRSNALQQYELCKRILLEQIGVEPATETTTLYERIRVAGASPRHNLPAQPTMFVGRAKELAQIETALLKPECRLVTLLGAGGIGKTRLALQSSERALKIGAFLNGVYFVSLADVTTTNLLVSTMANACEFTFSGKQDPQTQLVSFLREKEILFVLDNFEQLVDAAAWLSQILKSAPHVKFLVTSRERLNLQWEWLVRIEGLDYPTPDQVDKTQQFGAVHLFVERARQANPDFELNDATRASVARVCQLVGGMPLGIELAAAWVQTHTCDEIARAIERGYDFLATTLRDAPERQRSLRAAFDYSWNLLSVEEQRVLRNLSVFLGGFDDVAAKYVTRTTPRTLATLLGKSLIQKNAGRYTMHEMVRQFAQEKLEQGADEAARVADLHIAYFSDFLHQRADQVRGAQRIEALDQVDIEIANVRVAWQRAIACGNWGAIDQAIECLFLFYDIRSWYKEGKEAFGLAIQTLSGVDAAHRGTSLILARLLARQALFQYRGSDYAQAKESAQTSLAISQRLESPPDIALALNGLGNVAYAVGEFAEARAHYLAKLAIERASGDPWRISVALNNLGNTLNSVGEWGESERCFKESIALRREIGDRFGLATTLDNLGMTWLLAGKYAESIRCRQESLAIAREIGDRLGTARTLNNLGRVLYLQKEYIQAEAMLRECLAYSRQLGNRELAMFARVNLGAIASDLGNLSQAENDFRAALEIAMEIHRIPMVLHALAEMAKLQSKRGNQEHALDWLALVRQHPAITKEIRDIVEPLFAELTTQLAPDVFTAAQERAKTRKLEEVVAEILQAGR